MTPYHIWGYNPFWVTGRILIGEEEVKVGFPLEEKEGLPGRGTEGGEGKKKWEGKGQHYGEQPTFSAAQAQLNEKYSLVRKLWATRQDLVLALTLQT